MTFYWNVPTKKMFYFKSDRSEDQDWTDKYCQKLKNRTHGT